MDATERLLRGFCGFVCDTRAAFHRGDYGSDKPLETIEEAARRLAADRAISIRQGAVFAYLLPEETAMWGPAALGMWLAAQMTNGAQELEDGRMVESEVKRRIDAVIATILDRMKH